MPLTYTYHDGYLSPLITQEREERATGEVADLGAIPATWAPRLIVLRAYMLVCMESMKSPDDLFAAKLSSYRKEFDSSLQQARAAQSAAASQAAGSSASGGGSLFTVELFRS